MKAQEYLKARGVEITPLENSSVGRLTIGAEFEIEGKRGVVVAPSRGSVSGRYLSLLSEEGVSFVVAEGGAVLSFFGLPQKGKGLVPVRALKSGKSKPFPTQEMFEYLSTLLRQSVKSRAFIGVVASTVLLARIADEKAGNEDEWGCSVTGSVEDCSSLLNRVTGRLKSFDADADGVLRVCAAVAGFRLTPGSRKESALLIDWISRTSDDKKSIHGLPLALSPVFQVIGKNTGSVSVVTAAIGSQFSVLSGKTDDVIILEDGTQESLSILQTLYPNARIALDNYLDCTGEHSTNTVILIPPLGQSLLLKTEMPCAGSFFKGKAASKKYPAEYLYTFKAIDQCQANGIIVVAVPEGLLSGANHKAFRDWLLENAQILGVVSLPAGFCFSGTAVRCSILFIKKTDPLPSDYPISMIELRSEDFESDVINGTVEAVKGILQPENQQ